MGAIEIHIIAKLSTQEIAKTLRNLQMLKYDGRIKNIEAFTAKTFENKFKLGFLKNKIEQ